MTNLELTKRASEIVAQFRDETISDEEIIRQIKEEPELIHVKCLSGTNLFLDAVRWDRFFHCESSPRDGGRYSLDL